MTPSAPPHIGLNGLSPAAFLTRYWQRQPLLVRAAWPGFEDPITPEELAGLALDPQVESRLVEFAAASPGSLRLRHGPFSEADFQTLPDRRWTLLVQDVDKLLPPLAGLLEPFRFLPDWRIDDVMVSYAAPGGGVGPHRDGYDVFLLQGQGQRRWQIDARPSVTRADNDLAKAPLRIIDNFQPRQEWLLEAGDMLYLPPGVAHNGVAVTPCLTYSIGFRAPDYRALLSRFVDFMLDDDNAADNGLDARYRDGALAPAANPGEIDAEAIARVGDILRHYLGAWPHNKRLVGHWFGRFITEPKPGFESEPLEPALDPDGLRRWLSQGRCAVRAGGSRIAYSAEQRGTVIHLFANGRCWRLDQPRAIELALLLCRERAPRRARLAALCDRSPAALRLLLELVNEGVLIDDDE